MKEMIMKEKKRKEKKRNEMIMKEKIEMIIKENKRKEKRKSSATKSVKRHTQALMNPILKFEDNSTWKGPFFSI